MNINEELVARFLNNDCSREEAEYITAYFEAYPHELEKYIGEAEWKQFTTRQVVPANMSRQILQRIKQEAAMPSQHRFHWYMAAAAAVLLLITGSVIWMNIRPVHTKLADNSNTAHDSVRLAVIRNASEKDKLVTLEDGSVITLTPGSELQYMQPFESHQRYMRLEGKGFFKVAKDKRRPFKVAAGGLMTTALGTSFWVEAGQSNTAVRITLVTGKVTVQQDTIKSATYFKPVYLAPGQEFAFDRQTHVGRVSYNDPSASNKKSVVTAAEAPAKTLVFNQQPLPAVLRTLQQQFHITIAFNEEEIRNIKFSGSYSNTDTPEEILKVVVLINELKLERTATGFSISR